MHNTPVPYFDHVDVATIFIMDIFTSFLPQSALAHLRPRYICQNCQCFQDGIRGPPTQTPSSSQWPADCRGSGLGCQRWGPLTIWAPGTGSVSGIPPSLLGFPWWRGGGGSLISGVYLSVKTLKLNTFGPWKHVDSMLQSWGRPQAITTITLLLGPLQPHLIP